MNDGEPRGGVIKAGHVRRIAQPALLDCAQASGDGRALTVIPMMDGDRVAGLEVKCCCGASVVVECVYEEER